MSISGNRWDEKSKNKTSNKYFTKKRSVDRYSNRVRVIIERKQASFFQKEKDVTCIYK